MRRDKVTKKNRHRRYSERSFGIEDDTAGIGIAAYGISVLYQIIPVLGRVH
jgi:hypothetical protein